MLSTQLREVKIKIYNAAAFVILVKELFDNKLNQTLLQHTLVVHKGFHEASPEYLIMVM